MIGRSTTDATYRYTTLFRSPLAGSRVNATPVALVSPILPNTIVCTLTAVPQSCRQWCSAIWARRARRGLRSEEHTSELQSLRHLVSRLLPYKKNYADLERTT